MLGFKREAELALIASGMPYTVLRPSRLTDGPYTSFDVNTLLKVGACLGLSNLHLLTCHRVCHLHFLSLITHLSVPCCTLTQGRHAMKSGRGNTDAAAAGVSWLAMANAPAEPGVHICCAKLLPGALELKLGHA